MKKITRRNFLGSAAALGGMISMCPLGACKPYRPGRPIQQQSRPHPLAGVTRENIRVSDVRVTLLSYETPPEKRWIPSWEPPVYEWWKTDSILVEIFTDRGITGIGGASRYGSDIEDTKRYIEEVIEPSILGQNPFDMELLAYDGPDTRRRVPWAGVAAAFWDIIGKATGQPVYRMLATENEPRPRIPVYASSGEVYPGSVWPGDLIEEALRHKEKGFKAFKFRPGWYWPSVNMTVEKFAVYLKELREAVGPDFNLIFEANGLLSLEQALELAPVLEELKFLWIEKPLREEGGEAMDKYLRIQEALPNVMVSGLEKEMKRHKIMDWLGAGAIDIVQPDCSIAGITESWYYARSANIRNKHFCPHNYQGGLTTMQNAHLAAGNPNLLLMEMCECFDPLKEEIFKEPLVMEDGYMQLSAKPGFGVELIDEPAKKFPYIPGHYQRRRTRS